MNDLWMFYLVMAIVAVGFILLALPTMLAHSRRKDSERSGNNAPKQS